MGSSTGAARDAASAPSLAPAAAASRHVYAMDEFRSAEWRTRPRRVACVALGECRSWSPPPAGKLRMARATRRADVVGERHVGATKRPECRLWSPPAYCALRRTSSAVSHTTRRLSDTRKLLESGLLAPPSGRGADCGLLRPPASCALRSSGGAAGHIILTMRMRSWARSSRAACMTGDFAAEIVHLICPLRFRCPFRLQFP